MVEMPVDTNLPLDYPESDGRPMGETDIHVTEISALLETLRDRYRDRPDVHVAGNSFIYYEEGNPGARFSPDIYVVFGVPKGLRRIYKLWEEQVAPSGVFTHRSPMIPRAVFIVRFSMST